MANVFPQNGDSDSGTNFSLWTSRKNISNYVHEGFNLNPDYANNTLEVTGGYAFITHNNEDKVLQANDGESNLVGISLQDNAVNHVFLNSDFSTNNHVDIVTNTDGTTPSNAYLKIGEVDTGANTANETNRKPVLEGRSASIDSLNLEGNTTLKDDQRMFFGTNKDFSISYDSTSDNLALTDEINGHSIVEWDKDGRTQISDGLTIEDDAGIMLGTDEDFLFGYDSTSDSLKIANQTSGEQLELTKGSGIIIGNNAKMEGNELSFGGNDDFTITYSSGNDSLNITDNNNNTSMLVQKGGNVNFGQNVNFSLNEAINFVIENRTSDPSNPETGQIWIRTDML